MTKVRRRPWTTNELALLRQLCEARPALCWSDIAARLPGRTVNAVQDKWKELGGQRRPNGRPRRSLLIRPIKPPDEVMVADPEHDPDQIRAASAQLAAAIADYLARRGEKLAA